MNNRIEELNYANDARNQPAAPTTLSVFKDGDWQEIDLPTKWEVCSVCDGAGKHVNPSIDAGGLTSEDFCDDPVFEQDYMDGVYDVTCYRCKGRTTERVVDYEAMPLYVQAAYDRQCEQDEADRREHQAERAMGA